MKTTVPIKCILSLIVITLFWGCSNKKNENNEVNSNLDTTSSQELKLHQRRIVYQIPEMEDVVCHKGEIYYSVDSISLEADIYIPPGLSRGSKLPVVILTNNYPESYWNKNHGVSFKDWGMIISWAELIAASGMVAVAYQTKYSPSESENLISYLSKNAAKFNIDINRIAVFGCSANVLSAQSLLQNDENNIKCAIFYYGLLLTPDQKYYAELDTLSSYGFYFSGLRKISKFPTNIPVLVVRAGKDQYSIMKETTDHFVTEAIKSNAQITFINDPEGRHDFDVLDDTDVSRDIIKNTIIFLKTYLLNN